MAFQAGIHICKIKKTIQKLIEGEAKGQRIDLENLTFLAEDDKGSHKKKNIKFWPLSDSPPLKWCGHKKFGQSDRILITKKIEA